MVSTSPVNPREVQIGSRNTKKTRNITENHEIRNILHIKSCFFHLTFLTGEDETPSRNMKKVCHEERYAVAHVH